jgi:hypothetical protein
MLRTVNSLLLNIPLEVKVLPSVEDTTHSVLPTMERGLKLRFISKLSNFVRNIKSECNGVTHTVLH